MFGPFFTCSYFLLVCASCPHALCSSSLPVCHQFNHVQLCIPLLCHCWCCRYGRACFQFGSATQCSFMFCSSILINKQPSVHHSSTSPAFGSSFPSLHTTKPDTFSTEPWFNPDDLTGHFYSFTWTFLLFSCLCYSLLDWFFPGNLLLSQTFEM